MKVVVYPALLCLLESSKANLGLSYNYLVRVILFSN